MKSGSTKLEVVRSVPTNWGDEGELGSCLTELKIESPGQRRVNKAIAFLLSKSTEIKSLRSERGPNRVATESF